MTKYIICYIAIIAYGAISFTLGYAIAPKQAEINLKALNRDCMESLTNEVNKNSNLQKEINNELYRKIQS